MTASKDLEQGKCSEENSFLSWLQRPDYIKDTESMMVNRQTGSNLLLEQQMLQRHV